MVDPAATTKAKLIFGSICFGYGIITSIFPNWLLNVSNRYEGLPVDFLHWIYSFGIYTPSVLLTPVGIGFLLKGILEKRKQKENKNI